MPDYSQSDKEKSRSPFTSHHDEQRGSRSLPAVPAYRHDPIQKNEQEEELPVQQKSVVSGPVVEDSQPEATAQRKPQETASSNPQVQKAMSYQQMANNSPQVRQLRAYQEMANNSDRVKQLKAYQEMANNSPQVKQLKAYHAMANGYGSGPLQRQADPVQGKAEPVQRVAEEEELLQGKFAPVQKQELDEEEIPVQQKSVVQRQAEADDLEDELPIQGKLEAATPVQQQDAPVQKKPNNTGLPNNLKEGVENLSGYSMDDVKVHYNSDKPAQLQALAYAQGTDIHVGPGQEQHLPHEAWHVVQQKQGRVQPTMQMKEGVPVNDDKALENEADEMGEKLVTSNNGLLHNIPFAYNGKKISSISIVQKTTIGDVEEEVNKFKREINSMSSTVGQILTKMKNKEISINQKNFGKKSPKPVCDAGSFIDKMHTVLAVLAGYNFEFTQSLNHLNDNKHLRFGGEGDLTVYDGESKLTTAEQLKNLTSERKAQLLAVYEKAIKQLHGEYEQKNKDSDAKIVLKTGRNSELGEELSDVPHEQVPELVHDSVFYTNRTNNLQTKYPVEIMFDPPVESPNGTKTMSVIRNVTPESFRSQFDQIVETPTNNTVKTLEFSPTGEKETIVEYSKKKGKDKSKKTEFRTESEVEDMSRNTANYLGVRELNKKERNEYLADHSNIKK